MRLDIKNPKRFTETIKILTGKSLNYEITDILTQNLKIIKLLEFVINENL